MVHFPPLPSPAYVFSGRYSGMSQSGFPHSEIPGSKPACGSPRLIAACHVLHRLLAPRHSPYALSSLTKCSLHLTANMWSKNYRLQIIQLSKNLGESLTRLNKLVVRLRGSTFALRATVDNLRRLAMWLANRSSLRSARCQAERLESEGWRIPGSNR